MKPEDLEMSKKADEQTSDLESHDEVDSTDVSVDPEATSIAVDASDQDASDDNTPVENTEKQQDSELENIIEAALFAAKEPLGIRKITALFPDEAQPSKVDIQNVIISLQEQCEFRGVELRRIGVGWRFQTKEKYSPWLRKISASKAPRYSRALLETLSIIAYRQPVTRGDIEEIRGVGVSSDTIRTLEERDWVAQIGHRDVPGRPALFGTTQGFLEYFDMTSLRDLPELVDKRELGEIAKDMNLTLPMDGVQDGDEAAKAKSDNDANERSQATAQFDALENTNLNDSETDQEPELEPVESVSESDIDAQDIEASDNNADSDNSDTDNLDNDKQDEPNER